MNYLHSIIFFFLCTITSVQAQENTSYAMENHIVYYNVFNSSMITPDIARIHNLIRAKDRVYLNVAVVKKTGGNAIPAIISGQHRNLMQQKFDLEFIEIKETTATYYLAPIRFNNEEILHIDITAAPADGSETASFTITKKLYQD
jgi:hypothetical protein